MATDVTPQHQPICNPHESRYARRGYYYTPLVYFPLSHDRQYSTARFILLSPSRHIPLRQRNF